MANDDRDQLTSSSSPEERARKQARMRQMTDPLGAMGFRDTRQRYRREARARRAIFGGAAASLVVGTALIVAAGHNGTNSASVVPQATSAVQQSTVQQTTSQISTQESELPVNQVQKAKIVLGLVPGGGTSGVTPTATQTPTHKAVTVSGDDGESDDGEEEYSPSSIQSNAAPSSNATSSTSDISISQQPPHTRTNSSGS